MSVSDFEPLSFTVTTFFDVASLAVLLRLSCHACVERHEDPEAVATWKSGRVVPMTEFDAVARAHWTKWHQR